MIKEKLAMDGGAPVRMKPFPEWPVFGEPERMLLMEAFESGKWGGANRNKLPELESVFAQLHGAKHAITMVNGTMSLTIALKAAGIKPGDEVIMPAYTFVATATSALLFGAIPVFVDVEPDTLMLDPKQIEQAITPKTKGIIAVHLAGAPADMTALKKISEKHGLKLIEDAAQAVGAVWDGEPVGALGDFGSFSFQGSKNITAGEGGILLTNDDEMADTAWSLANVGRIKEGRWYQHERIGWNLRMTEFQAAVLLGQLTRLEGLTNLRESNAKLLSEQLQEIDGIRLLRRDPRVNKHSYHLYIFGFTPELAERVPKQDFIDKVNAEGIPLVSGYVPLNDLEAIKHEIQLWTGQKPEYSCPVSERASEKDIFWLNQRVLLGNEQDIHDISAAIEKVIRTYA